MSRRHCSGHGVPFSPSISAFLDAASARYLSLSSLVWLTPHAMGELGVSFKTSSPTPVPLGRRHVVAAHDANRCVISNHLSSSAPTSCQRGGYTSAEAQCILYNAAETTWEERELSTAATRLPQQQPSPSTFQQGASVEELNVFGCPWPLHLQQLIQSQIPLPHGGTTSNRCWISPAQSHSLCGVPWSLEELEEAAAKKVAVRVPVLTRSHMHASYLVLIPPSQSATVVVSSVDDGPTTAVIGRKRQMLSELFCAPWASLSLSRSCNVYGEPYAFSTASALKCHWIQQVLHLQKNHRHHGKQMGEAAESSMQRVLRCVNDPDLSPVLFRWGTIEALRAVGVEPLPWVTPARIELEGMSPVLLYNVALTNIALDPLLLKTHPLLSTYRSEGLAAYDNHHHHKKYSAAHSSLHLVASDDDLDNMKMIEKLRQTVLESYI
ncbi:Hypothetical protein, putative [Bodo saltans]|uniref:Uncharacterized protein n=1 Tax=Bodo saltans TaxID=75058 RepID=A0A0S4JME4_BODSA|nr:Hypothetical protein, putative [Bodo saltans]|eukprot:CUG92683.1 Hypothetical protein, putative [Bodo saltans]